MARLREALILHRDLVLVLFAHSGLKVKLAKSDLAPTQVFIFHGLCCDTVSVYDKVVKLESQVSCIRDREGASCWRLQKFLGLNNFASVAVPRACIFSHYLQMTFWAYYYSFANCFRWCAVSVLALQELQWWASLLKVSKPLSPALPSVAITTDASRSGWGASWGANHLAGCWPQLVCDHINVLELRAIWEALCFGPRALLESSSATLRQVSSRVLGS